MPVYNVTMNLIATAAVKVTAENSSEARRLARIGVDEDEFGTDLFRDSKLYVVDTQEVQ